MTMVNATVAQTIYNIADFGSDPQQALIALCAALFAIVSWAVLAWKYGIPNQRKPRFDRRTVRRAAIACTAVFRRNQRRGVDQGDLRFSPLDNLRLCAGLAERKLVEALCAAGWIGAASKTFFRWCSDRRRRSDGLHARAQDGQKFMGVFLLGVFLAQGQAHVESFVIPDVAHDSVFPRLWGWVRASAATGLSNPSAWIWCAWKNHRASPRILQAALCLLASSLTGIPVSTTHEDDGDHGRRRGAKAIQRELGQSRQGYGDDVDSGRSPAAWTDRLFDGQRS